MAGRPLIRPFVTTRVLGADAFSKLGARVTEKPTLVRVGLPDSVTTEEAEAIRKARRNRGRRGRRRNT